MACRKCGHEHPPEATVCPECGADLTASPLAPDPSAPFAPELRLDEEDDVPRPPPAGGRRLITILVAVAALAALLACASMAVFNVVSLQQLHERSVKRNAIVQQRAVPAPNTIGQSDNEAGPSEPDTAESTSTASGRAHDYPKGTPEATVAGWYAARAEGDAAKLRALAVPALGSTADLQLASSALVTSYRLAKVATTGSASTITVEQTAGERTVAVFTLQRQPDGTWLIDSLK